MPFRLWDTKNFIRETKRKTWLGMESVSLLFIRQSNEYVSNLNKSNKPLYKHGGNNALGSSAYLLASSRFASVQRELLTPN